MFIKEAKVRNYIGGLYRRYKKENKNNLFIADGAEYGNAILTFDGEEVFNNVLKNKNIKLCSLRQDKKINDFFWIGMKLIQNAER